MCLCTIRSLVMVSKQALFPPKCSTCVTSWSWRCTPTTSLVRGYLEHYVHVLVCWNSDMKTKQSKLLFGSLFGLVSEPLSQSIWTALLIRSRSPSIGLPALASSASAQVVAQPTYWCVCMCCVCWTEFAQQESQIRRMDGCLKVSFVYLSVIISFMLSTQALCHPNPLGDFFLEN